MQDICYSTPKGVETHRLRTIGLVDEVRGLPWVHGQPGINSEFLARCTTEQYSVSKANHSPSNTTPKLEKTF